MKKNKMLYPDNKKFIFTIFDDTDVATVENIRPIYSFLSDVGLLTTKSVWPLRSRHHGSDFVGTHTLLDAPYADYIKQLSTKGFEIAFHGAAMESSTRDITQKALDKFHDTLGFLPTSYACHAGNKENIYWGEHRFSFFVFKQLYRLINYKKGDVYQGNNKSSKYFWGDICQKHFDYVRTFTYNDINLYNITKSPLYTSAKQPYFKSCFITNDADNVEEFNTLISLKNQRRLENQQGICILSTHFGKGFVKNGKLHPETRYLLSELSKRDGWFVPVSTALKYLGKQEESILINRRNLFALELKWFIHSIQRRFLKKEYEKTELEYLAKQ